MITDYRPDVTFSHGFSYSRRLHDWMRYSKCSIRRIYLRRALYTAAVIRADCAIPSCVGMIMQEFPTQLSDRCICWNIYFKQYQGGNCVCFGHISHMITPCSWVPRCRVIILGQYWFRLWLVVWRHQAIAWTNVDLLSVKSCAIHHMSISQKNEYNYFIQAQMS